MLVRIHIQPGDGAEVSNEVQVEEEIVEVEDEDLVYQCGEDGRNLLTGRARSSRSNKKRKGNRGTFVRTYDEMIEMELYYSSDESCISWVTSFTLYSGTHPSQNENLFDLRISMYFLTKTNFTFWFI